MPMVNKGGAVPHLLLIVYERVQQALMSPELHERGWLLTYV